jgi:hypothetical protein
MEVRRTSFIAGVSLALLMALGAAMTPAILRGASGAVDRVMRPDIAWTGQTGRLELHDFAYAALAYRWSPGAANHERLRTTHGLLLSRIEDWTTGAFGAFVETSPERIALLEKIVLHTLKAENLFARLNEPIIADRLFKLIGEIEPLLDQMAEQAFARGVRDRAVSGERLLLLQNVHQGVTTALMISGLLLAWLLARKGLVAGCRHNL